MKLEPTAEQLELIAKAAGMAVWEMQIAFDIANHGIPEGAPVGTIARRPDGAWKAERKAGGAGPYWHYSTSAFWRADSPDWNSEDDADSWPVIYDPDEYHEGDKPRLERLMREPSVFDADPTAQQEPCCGVSEVYDCDCPPAIRITPRPRTPRVVDRLGVDEQGSRWRNRRGEVHEFRDGCWKYKDGRRWFPSSLSFPEYTEIVGPRVLPSLECEEARDGTIWEYTKDGVAHRVQFLGERWVCLSCDLALIGSELTAWSPYTEVLS